MARRMAFCRQRYRDAVSITVSNEKFDRVSGGLLHGFTADSIIVTWRARHSSANNEVKVQWDRPWHIPWCIPQDTPRDQCANGVTSVRKYSFTTVGTR